LTFFLPANKLYQGGTELTHFVPGKRRASIRREWRVLGYELAASGNLNPVYDAQNTYHVSL